VKSCLVIAVLFSLGPFAAAPLWGQEEPGTAAHPALEEAGQPPATLSQEPSQPPDTSEEIGQPAAGTPEDQLVTTVTDTQPETGFDIREDIARARAFLSDAESGYTVSIEKVVVPVRGRHGGTKLKVLERRVIEPVFLLAVEDLNERDIKAVRFTSKGCETEGFDVVKIVNNGVASRFEVRSPGNMAVLALRTMVRGGRKGYREVIYTPYSPQIDTPEVREEGLTYLKSQIESAWGDLEKRKVALRALQEVPDDVAPTEISLVLSIVEHIDPLRFKKRPPGGETALVHEVLTIIGANENDAYAYSRSPAGARGLFQFIPRTYEKMLRKYRGAALERSFVAGSRDLVNAAKASLLLFDSDLGDLPSDYLLLIGNDAQTVPRYLAAAYNCGSKRVERSLKACSDGWTCHLPEETKTYLKKFDAVWRMREWLDK